MTTTTHQSDVAQIVMNIVNNAHVDPFDLVRERRGWTTESLAGLGVPTSERLPDLDVAAEIIHRAITTGSEITVLTDYDMDGVAAGVLAYAGLAELGAKVNLQVPHYEGPRDVTVEKVTQAYGNYPETKVVMTCDVGINSNDGFDEVHRRGGEVIVADHHIQEVDRCHAEATVDPNRTGCTYPETDICGSQVVMHILNTYVQTYAPHKSSAMMLLTVFAGIGALADMMPLTGQTRHLIESTVGLLALAVPEVPVYTEEDTERDPEPISRWQIGTWNTEDRMAIDPETCTLRQITGPPIITDQRCSDALYGLAILLTEIICADKIRSTEDIDVSFLGFTLTPMFNATRRMGGDMADAFAIFAPQAVVGSRPDYLPAGTSELDVLARRDAARQLIANNELRKEVCKQAADEMRAAEQPYAPYIWFSEARAGVLGLLASDMMTETGLPTIVLNPVTLSGSARSPESVDMLGTVNALKAPGVRAAGHHHACGVYSDTAGLKLIVDALQARIDALPEPTPADLRADVHMLDVDSLNNLSEGAIEHLVSDPPDLFLSKPPVLVNLALRFDTLGPYGRGFPAPQIRISFNPADCQFQLMSRNEDAPEPIEGEPPLPEHYKHLKIITPHRLTLLWWNHALDRNRLAAANLLTADVELAINEFMGNLKPQGFVQKITTVD